MDAAQVAMSRRFDQEKDQRLLQHLLDGNSDPA
jgi:hypothetical protein